MLGKLRAVAGGSAEPVVRAAIEAKRQQVIDPFPFLLSRLRPAHGTRRKGGHRVATHEEASEIFNF